MIETKICNICLIEKTFIDFHKDKIKKDGYRGKCKECSTIYMKTYYINNVDNLKIKNKIWRGDNMDSILIRNKSWKDGNKEKHKEIQLKSRVKNKDKIQKYHNLYNKKRKELDTVYKLRCYIGRTISDNLRKGGYTKKSRTYIILGCTYTELKCYLESKFESWMNWENYGNPKDGILELNKTWDIDHIKPLCLAKTEKDIIEYNHYSNLQPLCSKYNREVKKGNY